MVHTARVLTGLGVIFAGIVLVAGLDFGGADRHPDPAATEHRIDINNASADVLELLPGVGPLTAEKIVREREMRGGFRSIDELDEVPGIGPIRLERLRPFVTRSTPEPRPGESTPALSPPAAAVSSTHAPIPPDRR